MSWVKEDQHGIAAAEFGRCPVWNTQTFNTEKTEFFIYQLDSHIDLHEKIFDIFLLIDLKNVVFKLY